MTFEKSITKWIDVNGIFAEEIIKADMKGFLEAYEESKFKKET